MGWPEHKVIILTVWDPARCYAVASWCRPLTEKHQVPAAMIGGEKGVSQLDLWGYFAVDGANWKGTFAGPAGQAVGLYDRVLAYGEYGRKILQPIAKPGVEVKVLPHILGSEFHLLSEGDKTGEVDHGLNLEDVTTTIGCVATNQPRKDLGLFFEAAALVAEDVPINLWLHTDVLYRHWAIPELAETYGFNNTRLLVTTYLEPHKMNWMYNQCTLTVAPGLGEGFGYPIIESLACGAPVIHGNYGGGKELLPDLLWSIDPVAYRTEGTYALRRPVFDPNSLAAAIHAVLIDLPNRQWCALQVQHLTFNALTTRWHKWLLE